tara:strand:+ start:1768 stop:3357 length:1590 start_codon:yes stop_codon:yes gene_type:complete
MKKQQFDTAVVYTDGSHLKDPSGTGLGIHAYCYDNTVFNKKLGDAEGGIVPGVPEIMTRSSYELMPKKAIADTLPTLEPEDYKVFECACPLPISTSQVAELTAFLVLFASDAPFEAKTYHVYTDSSYLLNGLTNWLAGWKKKGWVRGDGGPVANKEIWQKIDKMHQSIKSKEIKLFLKKIKGHSDRYGNEAADRLAGRASSMSLNMHRLGELNFKASWAEVTDEPEVVAEGSSETSSEKPKAKLTKSQLEARILPTIAAQKLYYCLTNEPSPVCNANGEDWHYMLSGDHAKNKDDLALVGKFIPDTMFAVTFTKEPFTPVYEIANKHGELAWGDTPLMSRYDLISIVSGLHINRKKFCAAYRTDLDMELLELRENKNVMMFDEKTYISQLARPPLLSYRAIEIRDELAGHLKSIVDGEKHYIVNDITDYLFDEKNKPTKNYRNVDRSIRIDVNQPCSDKKVPVILSRGIDMPTRTDINRIKEPEGRYQIITWMQDTRLFRYALVYTSPTQHALWIGYYSATRLLTDKEL